MFYTALTFAIVIYEPAEVSFWNGDRVPPVLALGETAACSAEVNVWEWKGYGSCKQGCKLLSVILPAVTYSTHLKHSNE